MDPITHGLIGLALSTFSGQAVSIDNPIALGCALGAMVPDVDSIVRLIKDDAYYLKHHRGRSHSVPALVIFSVAITGILSFFFTDMAFIQVLIWTFIGALSHTLFDILNSYGAMLLNKKKKSSLLTLYDPILTSLVLTLIIKRSVNLYFNLGLAALFIGYLLVRKGMKKKACNELYNLYAQDHHVLKVTVLPSLVSFYKWDYIVATKTYTYVGNYNGLTKKKKVFERLDAECENKRAFFDDTVLGAYFNEFSPNLHLVHTEDQDTVKMRIIDLRYYVRNNFLHHASLEVCKTSNRILKSELHPYNIKKRVAFSEAS